VTINLQELRYLAALADHLHFGRAAAACGVSQPTLSTQLKKLEEFLGAPLFERTNKSVHITAFGEQVVVRARQALSETDAIVEMAEQQTKPSQRVIELGVIPTLCPYLLPWAMPVIRTSNPDIKLNVYEDFTANLIDRLIAHQLDAAIVSLPLAHRGFESLVLFEEPFWFACAKDHPLAADSAIGEAEMRDAEMLILTEGHCMRDQMLSICDSAQVQVTGGDFRATSLETIRQMVAAGMGCTLLPALAVSQAQESGICVRPLADRSVRRIGFVWRGSYSGADDIVRVAETISRYLPSSVLSLTAPH
jgi:LysR family transcriptional regulator, hydrogen peroxide-inducible genes activator